MASEFASKVALVTGAGSDIGRAMALAFGREGAKVVLSDSASPGGEETARQIRSAGGEAAFVRCNVSRCVTGEGGDPRSMGAFPPKRAEGIHV
jgi:NAD(P)-dependent dehydrogenase (short-subunit alcohol dehydrogenase family)